MDADRTRLAQAMTARRVALRPLQWKEVAKRAGMSEQNLLRIRNGEISLTPEAIAGIEIALRWDVGSVKAILAGGEPTLLSASDSAVPAAPETTIPATPHGSTLPLAAQDVLDRGELLDTEVIDLSEAGSDFHLLVVAKVGIKDDEEKVEKMRKAIEKWIMVRKGIRDMADYRPGPDPTPSDQSPSNG